jgi:hypothetical protein
MCLTTPSGSYKPKIWFAINIGTLWVRIALNEYCSFCMILAGRPPRGVLRRTFVQLAQLSGMCVPVLSLIAIYSGVLRCSKAWRACWLSNCPAQAGAPAPVLHTYTADVKTVQCCNQAVVFHCIMMFLVSRIINCPGHSAFKSVQYHHFLYGSVHLCRTHFALK